MFDFRDQRADRTDVQCSRAAARRFDSRAPVFAKGHERCSLKDGSDMPIKNVLASVAVKDLGAAVGWEPRMLGKPPDSRPMPGVWPLNGSSNGADGCRSISFLSGRVPVRSRLP